MTRLENAIMKPETITPLIQQEQISDALLERFGRLIYDRAGIRISPQKKTLLSNRLRRRLKATGIETFKKYFDHLKSLAANDDEWDGFMQVVTTHETFLFRDQAQWDWFRKVYLAKIGSEASSGKRQKSLRIWSAACSTGDEAYTIASSIADSLNNYNLWSIQILGTDIGLGAIDEAKVAEFSERGMRLVPDMIRKRHFSPIGDSTRWKAKDRLRSMTKFRQHNLLDPMTDGKFDLVFLKNVLIYFDKESKQKVIAHVAHAMKPGAHLVAGAAEGLSDLLEGFERQEPWLFTKK